MVSGLFLVKKYIATGPGMLYIVGKIRYEISFHLVYSESGHKDMKIVEYLFLSQSSGKHINLFKTVMEQHEQALYCHTHIDLSNSKLQIQFIGLDQEVDTGITTVTTSITNRDTLKFTIP